MSALAVTVLLALAPAPSAAAVPVGEIEYRQGALGYDALVSGDYRSAEQQLRGADDVMHNDPAWLINYGQVLARTGRTEEAAAKFRQAMAQDDAELVLADGRVMSSREAASAALKKLRPLTLSSR